MNEYSRLSRTRREKEKQTRMIVSQGLGNSSFPIRINNRLEYIVVTLHTL